MLRLICRVVLQGFRLVVGFAGGVVVVWVFGRCFLAVYC